MNLAELRHFTDIAKTPEELKLKETSDERSKINGQAGTHELMKELRTILDEYDGDRVLKAKMTTLTTWEME